MTALGYVSVLLAVAFALLVLMGYRSGWAWTGFSDKTLWDWLQLLVIPLALAAVAFGLNYLQSEREQLREDRRARRELAIADDDRRETVLRAYLDQMSDLMLDDSRQTAKGEARVRQVMRTSTLTTLRRLDGRRKGLVIQFLSEAGLIDYEVTDDAFPPPPVVSLLGADLTHTSFDGPLFGGLNLFGADLRNADFHDVEIAANLESADLRGADFSRARLTGLRLADACVSRSRFVEAHLRGADLRRVAGHGTDFTRANLRGANLRGATLPAVKLVGATLPDHWDDPHSELTSQHIDALCRRQFSRR